MAIPCGVALERDHALLDVSQVVNEYGDDVTMYVRSESMITRDKYNSIVSGSLATTAPPKYALKAYPIDRQPNRQMMEKAGIREQCDAIIWFATYDLTNAGIIFDSLECEKMMIVVDGNEYGVSEKGLVSDFANVHLYTVFGLFKR